jgi:TPR repeat protein
MSNGKRAAVVAGLIVVVAALVAGSLITHSRHSTTAAERKENVDQGAASQQEAAEKQQRLIREKLARDKAELDRSFEEWKPADWPAAPGGTWGGMPRHLAEQGNSAAQAWVGQDIQSRLGDYRAAIPWFEKAANQGDADAMVSLAAIYANAGLYKNEGKGDLPVDPEKALFWYRKAAQMGNKDAMWLLGSIYEEGRLTTPNYLEALKWYEMAAEAGNVTASIRLGNMYEGGRGVQKDNVQVYKWYSIACADSARLLRHLDAPSCGWRDAVASEMTSADVMRAQALASEWEREHRK